MMRISTGKSRGCKLYTLEGTETTRPTTERVKQAIFSMIQFDIEGRDVLDLFGGSGQMGLEAVSRGARHAIIVDKSKPAVDVIYKNMLKTKLAPDCFVVKADYADFLKSRQGREQYDIVFLDPPYASDALSESLLLLLRYDLLKPGARVICESDKENIWGKHFALCDRYRVVGKTHHASSFVTILEPVKEDAE